MDKLINVGYGNMVSMDRIIAVTAPDSASVKRMVQASRERGTLIDATHGRRTRSVLFADSDHIVLSTLMPATITERFGRNTAEETITA